VPLAWGSKRRAVGPGGTGDRSGDRPEDG